MSDSALPYGMKMSYLLATKPIAILRTWVGKPLSSSSNSANHTFELSIEFGTIAGGIDPLQTQQLSTIVPYTVPANSSEYEYSFVVSKINEIVR